MKDRGNRSLMMKKLKILSVNGDCSKWSIDFDVAYFDIVLKTINASLFLVFAAGSIDSAFQYYLLFFLNNSGK